MKEALNKIYNFVDNRLYFRLLYILVSLGFATIFLYVPAIKKLNTVVLAWGILLILIMMFKDYKTRKIYKFDVPIILFIIFTLALNIFAYRTMENIKIWIVNLMIFTSLYTIDVFKSKRQNIKEMKIISYFYIVLMLPLSIVSLYVDYNKITIQATDMVFGTGRSFGIFVNQNALSIAAGLAVVLSIYLIQRNNNLKMKTLLFLNFIIQGITMVKANGRSSYLLIIAVIYLFVFIYLKNKYLRIALLIIPFLCSSVLLTFNEDRLHGFTSGRNILWKSASFVIKDNPIIGVGNSDLLEAVKNARVVEYLPGIEYGGLHNIYLEVAATNGIISLVLILIFLISIMVFIIKKLDRLKGKEKLQMTTIASMLLGILAVNVFESNLVYIISFISIMFWIYLGYTISILDNRNISNNN
ncbi:O-antigen ligase [Clostridium botulinum]|uniref:O-antigen ligase family protein n=1 Tax=Clostridium botulinum TaxID=1491 RepID=UPI000A176752|nr:O-antigen ligase family protein [Clostridium botulinum]MBY6809525.1 O-antigen ligase family protein [Clostridium botulinum]MBY6822967.1 O-antigen ligase family protein [Clostridium botulinum]MBY6833579.1 O-antigen ligase family protein [Clostridium botulinum]MBY6971640.1 O-antigen ligase family protein [Clostridium botulinum]MCS6102541.1 O-antigen ligase family protein [Clostridium botulinum]